MRTIEINIIRKLKQKLFYKKWIIDIQGISEKNCMSEKEYDYILNNMTKVYLKHKPNAGDDINFYDKKRREFYYFHITSVDIDASFGGYDAECGILYGTIFK